MGQQWNVCAGDDSHACGKQHGIQPLRQLAATGVDDVIAVMLVDDEPLANAGMRELLSAYREIEITAVVGSLAEARFALRAHRPNVVFLDVEMPGGDTFSLLPALDDATRVVFVTAHEGYAVDAFAVGACRLPCEAG